MNEEIREAVARAVGQYLRPRTDMNLNAALLLAEGIKKKAAEMGVRAVIAVTNRGGNPILVESMDDAYIASYDIALNKAFTVVSLKMPTSALGELAQPGAPLYGIQFTNGGRIVIFGGGEPLLNADGEVIGGLGVSGGSEEEDTALGRYGKALFEKELFREV